MIVLKHFSVLGQALNNIIPFHINSFGYAFLEGHLTIKPPAIQREVAETSK